MKQMTNKMRGAQPGVDVVPSHEVAELIKNTYSYERASHGSSWWSLDLQKQVLFALIQRQMVSVLNSCLLLHLIANTIRCSVNVAGVNVLSSPVRGFLYFLTISQLVKT